MPDVYEIQVETIEKKTGTVTLTELPEGFEIVGVSKRYRHGREPQTYRFTAPRCDCREPDSARHRPRPRELTSSEKRSQPYTMRNGRTEEQNAANTGSLPLCPKMPGHNDHCWKTSDHCPNWGHRDRMEALLERVAKTYR